MLHLYKTTGQTQELPSLCLSSPVLYQRRWSHRRRSPTTGTTRLLSTNNEWGPPTDTLVQSLPVATTAPSVDYSSALPYTCKHGKTPPTAFLPPLIGSSQTSPAVSLAKRHHLPLSLQAPEPMYSPPINENNLAGVLEDMWASMETGFTSLAYHIIILGTQGVIKP